MIELICIGTLITIVIIISDRQKSKKYRKKHKTPKQKGIEGENVISNIIQYAPMYKKIVRNAYIDMNENKKTEIDIIAISTKGIYVIESKNYEGLSEDISLVSLKVFPYKIQALRVTHNIKWCILLAPYIGQAGYTFLSPSASNIFQ